jgi:hypothetical protein
VLLQTDVDDFISREVVTKRILNRYFSAIDISELPENSMNKLIEFSRECFRITWDEKDETDTKVFYG